MERDPIDPDGGCRPVPAARRTHPAEKNGASETPARAPSSLLPRLRELRRALPLYVGLALLGMGSTLVASLVGLQMSRRDFPEWTFGLVGAGFALGGILGAYVAPRVIAGVGHIRAFAALAALLACVVLAHALFPSPVSWGVLRLATGVFYYGLLLVAESWLNGIANDRNRARLLATYMIVFFGSGGVGQLLLNLSDTEGMDLFVVAGMILVLAVVPMALHRDGEASGHRHEALPLANLARDKPVAVFGAIAAGIVAGSYYALGATFGDLIGLDATEVSLFMAAVLAGALLLQWPIGWLSDHVPRQIVVSGAALVVAASAAAIAHEPGTERLYALGFVFGAAGFSLYPVNLAHAGDQLAATKAVGLSRSFLTFFAAGSAAGPLVASVLIGPLGAAAIFLVPAAAAAALTFVALFAGRVHPLLKRGFVSVPLGSLIASSLDPRRRERRRVRRRTHRGRAAGR